MKAIFSIKVSWMTYAIEGDILEVKCGSGITDVAFMLEKDSMDRVAVASRGQNIVIVSENIEISITCSDNNLAAMAAEIEEWIEEEA